jgi:hypothetical protein
MKKWLTFFLVFILLMQGIFINLTQFAHANQVVTAAYNRGRANNITIVQHKSGDSGSFVASFSLAFTSNVTAGNMLIYFSAATGGNSVITAATDNNSNTILNALDFNPTTPSAEIRVEYVKVSNSGSTTVTAHSTTTDRLALHIWEVSGLNATTPLDLTETGGPTTSTSQSLTTSGTTAVANELVFAGFYDRDNNASFSAGSGYSPSEFSDGGANHNSGLTEVKIVSSTGTQTATATCGSGTDNVYQIIATFK